MMKKILKLTSKVAVLVLLLSLTGCYYNEVVDQTQLPPVNDEISYALDIQPIFNDNCVVCHDGTLDPDLTEGNSYTFLTVTDPDMVVAGDADGSELYQRMNGIGGGVMPPSGALSAANINLVKTWINQGALNN